MNMEVTQCTKADFDQIIAENEDFWGHDRVKSLHNPVYLYEFGNTAYVIREGEKVIGYLFGLFSQTEPVAYVKFIGVRQSHQKKGVGRRLYEHFSIVARKNGYKELKAVTSPTNKDSIAFHRSIGMELCEGEPDENGIPVIRDYGGPGIHRVLFRKKI
jgi:L-amino acid N-acyltransferase YncA